MLMLTAREPLCTRLAWRTEVHRRDLARGFGRVKLNHPTMLGHDSLTRRHCAGARQKRSVPFARPG
ncbi:MAG TPA: hypothetical protein VKE40_24010 [Gemmataceae bacterium]|nr:hypothetical protein [Gemmataceae bacterium]